jgi:hypothetical protein
VAVKAHRVIETQTVMTPFVYDCFRHLVWGKYLEPTKTSRKVLNARRKREQDLHLTVDSAVGLETLEDGATPESGPIDRESRGERTTRAGATPTTSTAQARQPSAEARDAKVQEELVGRDVQMTVRPANDGHMTVRPSFVMS